MAPSPSCLYRLLVEGKDDKYTIINLLSRHGYDWDKEKSAPFVNDYEGIESLLKSLPSEIKSQARLGVVVDADLSLHNRWAQIITILKNLGFDPPSSPIAEGVVMNGNGFARLERIGFWIMPDNSAYGMIEDFLARLVPQNDTCWPHAKESTKKARDLGAPLEGKDESKGAIHAWLAWQKDPGQPFGTALAARTLNHESEIARKFVTWFHSVFSLQG